jgi:hypothetical protein
MRKIKKLKKIGNIEKLEEIKKLFELKNYLIELRNKIITLIKESNLNNELKNEFFQLNINSDIEKIKTNIMLALFKSDILCMFEQLNNKKNDLKNLIKDKKNFLEVLDYFGKFKEYNDLLIKLKEDKKYNNSNMIFIFDNENFESLKIENVDIDSLANYKSLDIIANQNIKILKEISFDTNFVSEFRNLNTMNIETKEFFIELFKKEEFSYNIIPYILENSLKEKLHEKKANIIDTLTNYECVIEEKRFDFNESLKNENIIKNRVEKKWKLMKKLNNEKEKFLLIYNGIYALLLECFYIKKIQIPNKDSEKKQIEEFVKFINSEFLIYLENESLLCLKYLRNDNNLCGKFFNLSSIPAKILDELKNRVWDLFHLRYLETYIFEKIRENTIRLPYFATKDKGLSYVIKNNFLSGAIINANDSLGNNSFVPIHEKNILNEFKKYSEKFEELSNSSRQKKIRRMTDYEKNSIITGIIKKLEKNINDNMK